MTTLMPPMNLRPESFPALQAVTNDYGEDVRVVRIRNCFVTHSGIALKRFRVLPESEVAARYARHFHRYAMYKYFRERRIRSSDPRLLLIHHHWASGYHHWLTECLLKLEFIDPARHVVVLPSDYPAFARESLSMYSFAGTLELPSGRALRARTLTVAGNPRSGHFNPAHLRALKERIVGQAGGPAADGERLYITRRGEELRRVENEDDVITALSGFGFEAIDPRTLTFSEQVRLFSGCRVLVSVHGAGLTNCMFMPEGSRVLELYRALAPANDGMNACYWRLTAAAGLGYYLQFCAHGENRGGDIDRTDIRVDIEELERNVEAMLTGDAQTVASP
jgi:capsular polysaccharide biosynthesis protein